MRIIAGQKRGLRIDAPKGQDTRPTLDRVREAIFGMIQFDIEGKSVLDMFAGSGAMGLEALSRGAASAAFCDKSGRSAAVVRQNIARLGYEPLSRVYECDCREAVLRAVGEGKRFDIVFLDPPYEYGLTELAITSLLEHGALNPGYMLICEYARTKPPSFPCGTAVKSTKTYGDVGVSIIIEEQGA